MVANNTKTRKAKGRKFQQEIAQKISKLLNIKTQKDGDIESRPMGQSGTDIILRGKARELFDFYIECKRTEQLSLNTWIAQAKRNSKDNRWLLFFRRNRKKPIVIMDCDLFFELYKEILKNV